VAKGDELTTRRLSLIPNSEFPLHRRYLLGDITARGSMPRLNQQNQSIICPFFLSLLAFPDGALFLV